MYLQNILGRVVGYTDVACDVAKNATRWGRVTGGIYAGDQQWFTLEPLHDKAVDRLIRAKRIHTVMSASY